MAAGKIGCSGPPRESRVTVAVLPFEDASEEKGLAYFSDAIAEAILYRLGRMKELRVTDRHSSFLFSGWEYDVSGIGEELGVTYVLKGRVDLVEKEISISTQLIEAARNRRVWNESFDGKLDDLFDLQDEIVYGVRQALALDTGGKIAAANTDHDTDNLNAFIDYALGRYYWLNNKAGNIVKSVEYLQSAVKADSAFALAQVSLADACAVMGYLGVMAPEPAFEACGSAAEKAVALAPGLSEAHSALGWKYFLYDWNWPEAEKELARAVDLSPDNATACCRYAQFLLAMGRLDEAEAQIDAALPSSPLQPLLPLTLGEIKLAAGDYKGAKKIIEAVVAKNPALLTGYLDLVQVYWALGENERALRLLAEGSESAGTSELSLSLLGHAWGKVSREDNALEIIGELEGRSEDVYVSSWNQALVYLGLGDNDKTVLYLGKAVAEKYPRVCFLNAMPMWDGLRNDARFQEILVTIGLTQWKSYDRIK